MAIKLGNLVSYYEVLPRIKSHNPFKHVFFWDNVTNQKRFIPITTVPEATKVCSSVTYSDAVLSIKSHDHLIK